MLNKSRIGLLIFLVSSLIAVDASAYRFGSRWQQQQPPDSEPLTGTGSTEGATLPRPQFDAGFESANFSGSANCADCHDGLRDEGGEDVSIVDEWSATMMAHAMRDPVFQAKVASELKRHPKQAAMISEKCLHCHAPMASIDAEFESDSLTLLADKGVLDPDNAYHDQAMEGVSCTVCHQIEDSEDLGESSSFSGGFTIPTIAESSRRYAYGQYESPFVGPMRRFTGIEPRHSAHMEDSALCGTCHNLHTPIVSTSGELISEKTGREFPEQTVYTEWEQSDFADAGLNPQSCQDCHMRSADGVRMATRPRRLAPVDDFKRHGFGGANTVVLSMLDRNRADLGVTSTALQDAIKSNREFLRTSAEVRILLARRSGETLDVDVEVVNKTGHKLPTGYPSRRVWIDLRVVDGSGREVFRSGFMQADGRIIGVDADSDTTTYEPHHDVITRGDQVQVYESTMSDTDGRVTYTLLSANDYIKDNRITPVGFDKVTAPGDVAVMGEANGDEDFVGGSDVVSYQIPVSTETGLTVTATLRYQPLSSAYLKDLFKDDDLPLVRRLADYWRDAEIRAEVLASAQVVVGR